MTRHVSPSWKTPGSTKGTTKNWEETVWGQHTCHRRSVILDGITRKIWGTGWCRQGSCCQIFCQSLASTCQPGQCSGFHSRLGKGIKSRPVKFYIVINNLPPHSIKVAPRTVWPWQDVLQERGTHPGRNFWRRMRQYCLTPPQTPQAIKNPQQTPNRLFDCCNTLVVVKEDVHHKGVAGYNCLWIWGRNQKVTLVNVRSKYNLEKKPSCK